MVIGLLRIFAILGWLIAGIVFGPYLAEVVTLDITDSIWYKIIIKLFECFAGVMIGREIIFKKISKSGKQIICFLILFLLLSAISGLLIDYYIFHSFTLNYLLVGLAFSATIANLVPEKEL